MKITLPAAAYDLFSASLLKYTETRLTLPNAFETDKLYKLSQFFAGSRGLERLRFFLRQDEKGEFYLDYLYTNDDYCTHNRINSTGALQRLENYEGQFGWPELESEDTTNKKHLEMREQNARVQEILLAKGFEDPIISQFSLGIPPDSPAAPCFPRNLLEAAGRFLKKVGLR